MTKQAYQELLSGIRNYFKKSGFKKAVVGLSGGIDSSVTADLIARAIGKDNVHALIMPEIGISSEEGIMHAEDLAKNLGISYSITPINKFLKEFEQLKWKQSKTATMNTKARIRAVIVYNYANSNSCLVAGTSNKSELMLGYFTKYGDGAVDVEVIGDLWKTDIIKLAKLLKLPKPIITAPPSAELCPDHTDEADLGAGYSQIDNILKQITKGKTPKDKLAKSVLERIKINKHKRKLPPIIKLKGG